MIETGLMTILTGIAVFTLIRFGVLSYAVGASVSNVILLFPLSADFSTWYAGSAIFALAAVLALTAYAFHTALAGRPLFTAGFLDRN